MNLSRGALVLPCATLLCATGWLQACSPDDQSPLAGSGDVIEGVVTSPGGPEAVLNGTGSDALLAFDQSSEAITVIRVPYPLNTFTRGLDGRIDDPEAGWKGRGLWFTNGLDPIHHSEVGQSYVGHVQLRPDPLAR